MGVGTFVANVSWADTSFVLADNLEIRLEVNADSFQVLQGNRRADETSVDLIAFFFPHHR